MNNTLKMFEFIFKNEKNQVEAEEYVLAKDENNAKIILETHFLKNNMDVDYNNVEIITMKSQQSIKFYNKEKRIRIKDYIALNGKAHFVGSSAPEMDTLKYIIESKRIPKHIQSINF